MLNKYFQHQTDIAGIECNFRCPDACNAPGCRKPDIVVEVSLFDLIRLSLFLNTPVSHLFSQYCHLGLMTFEDNVRYKKLLIKMKKPCLFLSGNRCAVHDAKPLNCRLFPEHYHIKGMVPKLSKNPLFFPFPCMHTSIDISEKRKEALKKLRRMSLFEQALSYTYLFGVPNFLLDEKSLRKKLRQRHPKHRTLPSHDLDTLLNKLINSYSFIENAAEKISGLDAEPEIKILFEKLSDRVMMTHLMEKMARPDTVHRLRKGDIIPLKRSLQPPATCFM